MSERIMSGRILSVTHLSRDDLIGIDTYFL